MNSSSLIRSDDLGPAVAREPDVADLAHLRPADLDQAALHEAAGVEEARLHLVAAAPAEDDHPERHDRQHGRQDRQHARDRAIGHHGSAPDRRTWVVPQNSCVVRIPIVWIPITFATIDLAVARPTPTGPPLAK